MPNEQEITVKITVPEGEWCSVKPGVNYCRHWKVTVCSMFVAPVIGDRKCQQCLDACEREKPKEHKCSDYPGIINPKGISVCSECHRCLTCGGKGELPPDGINCPTCKPFEADKPFDSKCQTTVEIHGQKTEAVLDAIINPTERKPDIANIEQIG